jgi:hypothetical protein
LIITCGFYKSCAFPSQTGQVFVIQMPSQAPPSAPAKIKVPVSEEPQSAGLNNPFAKLEVK